MLRHRVKLTVALIVFLGNLSAATFAADLKSIKNGRWSDPKVWQPAQVPGDGDKVVVSSGTEIDYDAASDDVIHSIRVSGKLVFARNRQTLLNVALITVAPDGRDSDTVHDVHEDKHTHQKPHGPATAVLEVGTQADPIPSPHSARIRLHHRDGLNKDHAPAIVCRPGGQMTFSGAPMNRTWVELAAPANPKDDAITLNEAVTGWRVGDEIIITGAKKRDRPRGSAQYDHQPVDTEQRTIKKIEGRTITLGRPLENLHYGEGKYRSEVANLSRNVIVESADPDGVRGHTMFHRYSSGGVYYARFAHLGKRNTLGRYPIHFHIVRDTMRGSGVIGASIVDSHNRWVTVHGTQYLVVRDCVGYRSVGHGFFLEDGMEVYNVLDRNLGVQAFSGPHMRGQALPFDPNDGAAFWWANGRNSFSRNVACENFRYGYRYDSQKRSNFDSNLPIRMPDGKSKTVDIRTLPVYRFSDNESHSEGLYSFAFAGTDGAGPDTRHPHLLRDLTAWETHYALRSQIPTMLIENIDIDRAAYGVYRPWFENHVYRNVRIAATGAEPFNRGLDDRSSQHGRITVDGLKFERITYGGRRMPLIQISDNNLSGNAESHFRNVSVGDGKHRDRWPLVNRGGGAVVEPTTPKGVPVFIHDYFGPGRHAKVVSIKAKDLLGDGNKYHEQLPLTGPDSRVAEVNNVEFPDLLDAIDDQPPATIVTLPAPGATAKLTDGTLVVRGTTTDNGKTARVVVNGVEASDVDYNFHQWRVELSGLKPGPLKIKAYAVDAADNVEQTPHETTVHVVAR